MNTRILGLLLPHFITVVFLTATLTVVALFLVLGGDDDEATPSKRSSSAAPRTSTRETTRREPAGRTTKEAPARATGSAPGRGSRVSLREKVGQKFMPAIRGATMPPGFLTRARRGEIGGVILFSEGASASRMASLARRLQAAAKQGGRLPLLIATDQEGGIVRRMEGPPTASASQMGAGSTSRTKAEGKRAAAFLRDNGVNVNLAPVADVPESGDSFLARDKRTYGTSAKKVADHAAAFADGLGQGRVAATAKHFPGLGGSGRQNTDLQEVTIRTKPELAPFERLVGDGVPLVMMSNAIYSAYDPGVPAVLSRRIVTGLLREDLGFEGVVITDELNNPNVNKVGEASVRASRAGVDIMLYANDAARAATAYDTVVRAAASGALSKGSIDASYERIRALKCTRLELAC